MLQSSAKYQEDIVHLAPEESDRDALHEMQSSIKKLGMIGDQKIVQENLQTITCNRRPRWSQSGTLPSRPSPPSKSTRPTIFLPTEVVEAYVICLVLSA